jgi:hypothetical protein
MTDTRLPLLVATAALCLAGCASTSAGNGSAAGLTGANTSADQATTPASLAQSLLAETRVPTGAVSSSTAPVKVLRQSPYETRADGLIVRETWWTINESAAKAYAWVSHHQSSSLKNSGSGSSSGPGSANQESAVDFTPPHLPATVNSAQLSIAVSPMTAHTSAIGAYALVIPQPPRSKTEDVPTTVDRVTVITRRTTGQQDGGSVLGRDTVTGAAARKLVRDFNALKVQPPGEVFPCPMSTVSQTAIFRDGSQVWRATDGVCIGVAVTLNGHQQPTLDGSGSFSHDLQAAYGHPFPPPSGVNQPVTNAAAAPATATQ